MIASLGACQRDHVAEQASPGDEQVEASRTSHQALPPMPAATQVRLATGSEVAGWRVADGEGLKGAAKQQLVQARGAAQELKKRIGNRLRDTLEQGTYVDAFDLCKCATRPLCEGLGMDLKLRVGRTSFRLRNADNTPPRWAESVVAAVTEVPHAFLAPDGRLGYVEPLYLDDACVGCHGPTDQIDPRVALRLAETFPEDRAVGFEAGGLRGYVWVEVPAAEAAEGPSAP